ARVAGRPLRRLVPISPRAPGSPPRRRDAALRQPHHARLHLHHLEEARARHPVFAALRLEPVRPIDRGHPAARRRPPAAPAPPPPTPPSPSPPVGLTPPHPPTPHPPPPTERLLLAGAARPRPPPPPRPRPLHKAPGPRTAVPAGGKPRHRHELPPLGRGLP